MKMIKILCLRSSILGSVFLLASAMLSWAQEVPTFDISDPISLFEETNTRGANLAVNTDKAEVLFTTIDTVAIDDDPITGEPAQQAVFGFLYDTNTLEPLRDPFIIVGNPDGGFETHDVKYNPLSKQYVVVASAQSYRPNGRQLPLVALVDPSKPADESPVVKAFAYEPDSDQNFDDVAVAVSSNNGNILLVAERDFPGEGEGVVGALFDQEGNLLTPTFTRLDQLQPVGDEDDPDVVFLENNDAFLFLTNTDNDDGGPYFDRITGAVIQPVPKADGTLQVGTQQILGADRLNGDRQGHPAAIENPFTDELIGVFDYGNGADGGDIFYFTIGSAPDYPLTASREQIPYLEASGNNPYSHRHPQLAADPNSGVIVIMHNARDSAIGVQGMVFTLLGPDGNILPGRPEDTVEYVLIETESPIDNGANFHNVKYDSFSDSFLVIYEAGSFTDVVRLKITSQHLTRVQEWMLH